MGQTLIRVKNLTKHYKLDAGLFASSHKTVQALKGVTLDLNEGETYGLVGESGSGKTTLARALVQLFGHSGGTIHYQPHETPLEISLKEKKNLALLRQDVRYVFQDPASSLDPRMSVRQLLCAGLGRRPALNSPPAIHAKMEETLTAVGLSWADLERRPGEFSGGQRQRIALARALMSSPRILICDEVVSALDVSIQGQILNLLVELKQKYRLTILFIAHDLTVVSYLADRVGVMYAGLLMEEAPAEALVQGPLHPYTQLLYASVPRLGSPLPVKAEEAGGAFPAQGCPFAPRCAQAREICTQVPAPWKEVSPGHRVACHLFP